MPRLIWIFAGRTCHFVGFVMQWLTWKKHVQYIYWRCLEKVIITVQTQHQKPHNHSLHNSVSRILSPLFPKRHGQNARNNTRQDTRHTVTKDGPVAVHRKLHNEYSVLLRKNTDWCLYGSLFISKKSQLHSLPYFENKILTTIFFLLDSTLSHETENCLARLLLCKSLS